MWVRTPIPGSEFAQGLFAQQNVTVLPGSYIARETQGTDPGEYYVRMALVAEVEQCTEAAERIKQYVQSL